MKKLIFLFIVITTLSASFLSFRFDKSENAISILNQMFDSIKDVKTLRLSISAIERLGKTYSKANSEIKLQTNPRRLYFVNHEKKLELLYNQNQNNNKVLVKPNYIPNLNLDPRGNMMRKNQHYTIHELGFDFIGQSISLTIAKDKDGLKNFIYKGKAKKFNSNCYLIQYENNAYSYIEYIVGAKETASSISSKLIVNDYLLRYKNDLFNDFGFLKKGTRLLVPNLYCKKAILFIDDKLLLPVAVSLYDDVGLFESYEYPSISVNCAIGDYEFSKDNIYYGFK